ncbi:protein HGV2-like [Rhopilema esculentum]|uniref:protein HGV2-like n=1 Tax=Rhopilema esculentum TaxID=499914 RepID=UPI0031D16C28|eukprot:gene4981-21325_t
MVKLIFILFYSQEEIDKLISDGKKLYATKDIQSACDIFGDVCAKLAEKYGQTANQCGDAYLLYGKSLLDLARSESDVLGSSIPKGDIVVSKSEPTKNGNAEKDEKDEASTASDKEEGSTDDERPGMNGESNRSNGDVTAKNDDGFTEKENKSQEDNHELEEEDGNVDMAAGDENGKDEKEGDEMEDDEDDDDQNEIDDEEPEDNEDETATSEDVSTMQQAWEILELCRIVFARNESKEHKLKQAEANLLLGEIGMELEHYPEAIGDFMECLRIQERFLDSNDRRLAETFYNLGLAYSFDRHYGKSIEYYNKAISVINCRIQRLKDMNDGENNDELRELGGLLPDLLAKVEDSEYMKKTTEEIIKSAASIAKGSVEDEEDVEESTSFEKPSDSAEEGKPVAKVTDIGYLVRKKRKTDEANEVAAKKPKETVEEKSD